VLRIYQSAGIAFLFIPINVIAYAGVPQEKNNQVSGMINVMRNIGGSVGIALVATVIARRAQFHQSRLASRVGASAPLLDARVQAMARAVEHAGSNAVEATRQATFAIGRELVRQAETLATVDTVFLFAVLVATMLPLLLFARKGAGEAGHEIP